MVYALPTIAARVMTLPVLTFPRTLALLDRLLSDTEIATPTIATVLGTDPVLSAFLLGRVNAAAPSEPCKIPHAVVVSGTGTVQGLIRSTKPLPEHMLAPAAKSYALANATALMCRKVGMHSEVLTQQGIDDDTLHAIGMIHDLGTLIAFHLFPHEVAQASQRCQATGMPFSRSLLECLGVQPALLGSLWGHHLSLPPLLVRALHHQDEPLRSDTEVPAAMVLHIARNLVKGAGFCPEHDPFVEPIQLEVLDRLGLTERNLAEAVVAFFRESEELELFEGALLYQP